MKTLHILCLAFHLSNTVESLENMCALIIKALILSKSVCPYEKYNETMQWAYQMSNGRAFCCIMSTDKWLILVWFIVEIKITEMFCIQCKFSTSINCI